MNHSLKRRCLAIKSGKSTRGEGERFCGFTNPPLSSEGRGDMLALRGTMVEQGVRIPRVWYVSDRRRAQDTFEIMSSGVHMPVVKLTDKLREMNFGDFENLNWEELPTDFQRHFENCQTTPMNLAFPGGETFPEMCERVSSGALEILSFDQDDLDIGIVAHQGSIRLWQLMGEGLPPEDFFKEDESKTDDGFLWVEIDVSKVANWRRKYLETS